MRPLRSLLRRSPSERKLLIAAVLWLVFFRMGVWTLPFRSLKRLARTLSGEVREERRQPGLDARRIAWAIQRGSRYVPFASCLTQALAAQVLMGRYGLPAEIHIGVSRNASKAFAAHAWVVSQGELVVGGTGVESYRPIAVLGSARR